MNAFCPACSTEIHEFEPGLKGRPRAKCPNCDALERHRLFALLLNAFSTHVSQARRILEIAPHGPTRRTLRSMAPQAYIGLDLEPRTGPDALGDVTRLPFADGSLDLVVCMHVLEHIPDDQAAIQELARTLTTTGLAFIMVPRQSGALTDEDPDAAVDERIDRFGQADHVRLYGDDFERRLYACGLMPTVVYPAMFLEPGDVGRFGLNQREHVWICHTRRVGEDRLPLRSATERELDREVARRRSIELDPPVRIVRGIQRRIRRLRQIR